MQAVRIHRFGSPEVVSIEEVERPQPASDEVLIRVAAAGVGPWDTWIRAGKSALAQPLPLTLGSDFAGTVQEVGSEITHLPSGTEVYGVTNKNFTGAQAEFALAKASMTARKPANLDFLGAASIPVVAVTAWQMVHQHAGLTRGQRVLVLAANGNVGRYAVQLAARAGAHVIAAISSGEPEEIRALGANDLLDVRRAPLGFIGRTLDAVIDAAGGALQRTALALLRPGGVLISAVRPPDLTLLAQYGVRGSFFLVDVTRACLDQISELLEASALSPKVGTVLPLEEARTAHLMLEGQSPELRKHSPGKIVLAIRG